MITLLSPAKSLDFESDSPLPLESDIALPEHSKKIITILKKKTAQELKQLYGVSDKIAQLNAERIKAWRLPITCPQGKQAVFAFTGDVYVGLEASQWSKSDLNFAQKHLRILSGLYGILRPADRILPYRLEMGTRLAVGKAENLYQFWCQQVTGNINEQLPKSSAKRIVVNLASNEYFKVVDKKQLDATVVSPVFKDQKNGTYKVISFFAKKARGMMANYIVRERIKTADELQHFADSGYYFVPSESTPSKPVFYRDEQH